MPSNSTDCAAEKGDLYAGATAAASGLMDGAYRYASDSRAASVAVKGACETAGRRGTVKSDTELAESATISVEGKARQTDREAAGLIWTPPSVRTSITVPDYSSSE